MDDLPKVVFDHMIMHFASDASWTLVTWANARATSTRKAKTARLGIFERIRLLKSLFNLGVGSSVSVTVESNWG